MLKAENLSVGYEKKIIVDHISFVLEPGKIITLIGPNGSGKSTVLKTITKELKQLGGNISLLEKDYSQIKNRELAKEISMVMTEKVRPEIMTCREVISTGRYPYTNSLGILSKEDWDLVDKAIEQAHCTEVAALDFNKISDGQKQRVMLARAICQDTEILVLDEPTSFLDLYYKLDLMKIIRKLAKEQNKAVIMSLHELDLVKSISDEIVCINGSKVIKKGTPSEIFSGDFIQRLYGLSEKEFNAESASLNLTFEKEDDSHAATKIKSDKPVSKIERGKHAKILMVQGTMSNAGKSLLVAGLCRVFKQDGYRVAPFKSQNMALNSFITKEGLEMGRAQVMQAEACGIEPLVCMNPILLKPTNDQGSQVIVNGEVIGNMPAREYFKYKTKLIPDIKKAFAELEKQADIIVIEGAGSPAEINLRQNDIVNMGLAEMLDAPVLLVGDIDRGGVFAQLLGTISLLQEDEKKRVKGLVINKFRGDKTILDPGIEMLEEKAGIPVTGVLPYLKITVDDEDSLSTRFDKKKDGLINIGVIRLPRISNFSDYSVFEQMEEVSVHYVKTSEELEKMDFVIIPGSKNTIGDLKWLRESGLEAGIKKFAADGGAVFGICGGYQMLGNLVEDKAGVEEGGSIRGMELLDMETVLQKEKTRNQTTFNLGKVEGIFNELSGACVKGYEIHMGDSSGSAIKMQGLSQKNNVYGSYVHGFFDEGDIAFKVVSALAKKKGVELTGKKLDYQAFKESQYDILADAVREYMDMEAVYGMLREADF